jgi:hypothetical protein
VPPQRPRIARRGAQARLPSGYEWDDMANRKVVMDSEHPAMSGLQARLPPLALLSHLHMALRSVAGPRAGAILSPPINKRVTTWPRFPFILR